MSKFKKGLVEEIEKEKAFKKEQVELKEKYNLNVGESVVVVEKSNVYKFTMTLLVNLIKCIATIILLTLAFVGVITLIYPESRDSYVNVMNDIYYQLSIYLPFLK